jgi:hypothetical protein
MLAEIADADDGDTERVHVTGSGLRASGFGRKKGSMAQASWLKA